PRGPSGGLGGALRNRGRLRGGERQREKLERLRVVEKHFFKMRHEPALVDRVTGKAAAEMIVDPAVRDAFEREFDKTEIALLAGALAGTPQQLENRPLRKLRRTLEPAVNRIDDRRKTLRERVEFRPRDHDPALRPRALPAGGAPSAPGDCARSATVLRGTGARPRAARP